MKEEVEIDIRVVVVEIVMIIDVRNMIHMDIDVVFRLRVHVVVYLLGEFVETLAIILNQRVCALMALYLVNFFDSDSPVSLKQSKSDAEVSNNLEMDDIDSQTSQIAAILGFSGFKTTHQQKVDGNDAGAVYKVKPTKYRQYMNRRG